MIVAFLYVAVDAYVRGTTLDWEPTCRSLTLKILVCIRRMGRERSRLRRRDLLFGSDVLSKDCRVLRLCRPGQANCRNGLAKLVCSSACRGSHGRHGGEGTEVVCRAAVIACKLARTSPRFMTFPASFGRRIQAIAQIDFAVPCRKRAAPTR